METGNKERVSIIIVSWNGKKYVRECLDTMLSICRETNLEVILVDNASTDGTPEMVEVEFPAVKLIRAGGNLGFSKANNIGIRESTGEYVCLVNSDVRFTENCFEPLSRFLKKHSDVGIVGPKMMTSEGAASRSTMRFPTVSNIFGRALSLDRVFKKSKMFRSYMMTDFDHGSTRDVEILNGWFWMVPRTALDKVGLLDERFFIYAEDMDWCYRFHKAGKRVVFFAETEAVHYGGSSSAAAPIRFSLEKQRADWQFYRKHYSLIRRMGLALALIVHHSLRASAYGFLTLWRRPGQSEVVLKFHREVSSLAWTLGPKVQTGWRSANL